MPAIKARYWLLTIPAASHWMPGPPNDELTWIKGQREIGAGGYQHWQVACAFKRQLTLTQAKAYFTNDTHLEPSRSQAADEYVWKEDTRVPDT